MSAEADNKALVLDAFDTLFNKRNYAAAERYWSPSYIQHSAHIAPGREGLFALINIVHGRFSGHGRPRSWIAADILRIEDGILAEHWDVIEDEASKADSKSGLPMFGDKFPD
jgi:predicted SnoaL-like aldol condensation-catalyzing enzyme